ncbi:hypothetical protein POJ06DRAFT_263671 [Lipomyces tetrasporus]|uniref:Plasma membrane fusion protein PRM1 n=1 Tax=Lipomyces tetrasporus TaxID=54092 RepID=A0AAD7QL84_9ASCO|nr:uncharacterized protein POJ06DRAFT_263671 [Lipomyces tetrasporus]KAJ8096891.1 hypothetical protein POJ06DRAFT_263671 [Lipomyces tetrasporus]
MAPRRYWDGLVNTLSFYPPNTPPPAFSSTQPGQPQLPDFPILPLSLQPVGWVDLHPRDFPPDPPPGFPNNNGLTPYLTARSRLSQVWINRWTIICVLVLAKLLLSSNSLNSGLESARSGAYTACEKVEVAGSALVSVPYYMSGGTNELLAMGVEASVDALIATLDLLIVGIEEIVVFVVNLVTGTYVCLITMAVTGSVSTVLNGTEAIISWVNETIGALGQEINSEIDSFNSALANVQVAVEKIGDFFTGSTALDWPTLSIPEISELENLSIPSSINEKLAELEANLPDFADVQNATSNAIRYPFEILRNVINSSFSDYTFNRSLLPVPSRDTLTFCSDDPAIQTFFDDLTSLVHTLVKVAIIVLAVLAILAMLPMGYLEIRQWRRLRQRVYILTQSLRRTDKHLDPIDSFSVATSPLSAYFGLYITRPISSLKNKVIVRWLIAYVTYPPALLVLSLGVASLAAAVAQLYILHQIQSKTPALASTVGQLTDVVATKLQSKAVEWANGTNTALVNTEAGLNDDLFGWVWDATSSVNNTLNTFVDDMTSALNTAFGDTPLYTPVKDVLDCLITLKVKGIQNGLTWVHDNAYISLPRVNSDIIGSVLLSATNSTTSVGNSTMRATKSSPNATISSLQDSALTDDAIASLSNETSASVLSALRTLEDAYRKGISIELYFAGGLILLWCLVVLLGALHCAAVKYSDFKAFRKAKADEEIRHAPPEVDPTQYEHVVVPRPLEVPGRRTQTPEWVRDVFAEGLRDDMREERETCSKDEEKFVGKWDHCEKSRHV